MAVHAEPVREDLVVQKPRANFRSPGRTHITVNKEVKQWIKECVRAHWYLYQSQQTGKLHIAFHNHEDAMLFKLTWK